MYRVESITMILPLSCVTNCIHIRSSVKLWNLSFNRIMCYYSYQCLLQSEKCNFGTFKILCFHLYRSMLQCKEYDLGSTRITFSFIRLLFHIMYTSKGDCVPCLLSSYKHQAQSHTMYNVWYHLTGSHLPAFQFNACIRIVTYMC